jgi:hypothetical protein
MTLYRIYISISAVAAAIGLAACGHSNFATTPQAASFQQVPVVNNKVDILFISDQSSAMLTYRQQLAQQATAIINRLSTSGMDYHIAVTSTSYGASYDGGTFMGSPSIITSSLASPSASLQSILNFNIPGSDLQQSLMSMQAALSSPNITGAGAGFLRPDAMLAVIVISSDDDYSSGSVQSYVDFLNALKPPFPNGARSWVFNYVGSTNLSSSCGQFVNIGQRYLQMAAASSGLTQSICNADWSVVTTNLQVIISNLLTDYYLSAAPNLSTLVVTVDGKTISQDPVNGWSYQTGKGPTGNTTYFIRFNGTSIPNLYSKINVSFSPATAK